MKMSDRKIMKDLMGFKTVKLWIKKKCGSDTTRRCYLNRFKMFLDNFNISNPDTIVEEWKAVRYNWEDRQRFLDEWTEKIEE